MPRGLMRETSPLSRRVQVVLHIGTDKTGTSSIQHFLRDNRDRLAESGWLYPRTPGAARHQRLGLFLKSPEELAESPAWYRQRNWPGTPPDADPAAFRKAFRRRLFSEIESSGLSRVLFSDEMLFNSSDPALRRLRRLTDRIAESVRMVVYLRRQDDHLASRYQQGVKVGWVLRLREWVQEDLSGLYDYHAVLRRHQELLSPDALVVRRFEPDAFADGSLLQDFLDAAGVEARAGDLAQVGHHNESLDAESVEFLRLLNIHRVRAEGATVGLVDNRAIADRLAAASTGPTLTLPEPVLDGFMERWAESNRRVALELVRDGSGELFRRPRRTGHTTTEQRLDPSRLDHFLALAEVPERWHEPVRRLAEREARTG